MGLHAIILAGGQGERFWPLSRRARPKQFLSLLGSRSLLQSTVSRVETWVDPSSIWVVTGQSHRAEVERQVGSVVRGNRYIVEPVGRNTAPAIGAAASAVESVDPGGWMLVLPSDHWIPDQEAFRSDVERAVRAAEAVEGLHLFGVPITRPETGYGYLECGDDLEGHPGVSPVHHFHEKPEGTKAIEYAGRREFFWNSGIFLFRAQAILEALLQFLPETAGHLTALCTELRREGGTFGPASISALADYMGSSRSESIDHAVLERHGRIFATRATFRWSDLGGWQAWSEQVESDPNGNRGQGTFLLRDVSDCILYSEGGALAMLGVENLVVVRLNDLTLICSKDRAQEIRALVEEARGRDDLQEFL